MKKYPVRGGERKMRLVRDSVRRRGFRGDAHRASGLFLGVVLATTLVFNMGLTLLQTQQAWAAFPGANGKIAFDSNRDIDSEIFVMNADGTDQDQLTANAAGDYCPAWSPDGSKIAFDSDQDGDSEIFVMDADGTDQDQLTANGARDWCPVWSPDGTKIAFQSDIDGDWEIFVMDADGTDQDKLTDNAVFDDEDPNWSPDGSKIAFSSNRDGDWEIFVMDADGTDQDQLTANAALDERPDWQAIPLVSITITSEPVEGSGFVKVDGSPITTPQTYSWVVGETHTLEALSPVAGAETGTQYVWASWTDGGGASHDYVVLAAPAKVNATYGTQYYLTMQANPSEGGTVSPSSGWHSAGESVPIQASPAGGYVLSSWSGSGTGNYTGNALSATVTMNGPITETANFARATCGPTAAYGSAMAAEVVYMRYVRDQQMGSTPTGRILRDGWNAFYYLWSPTLARAIASSELLRGLFRVLFAPLLGTVYLAGATFTAISWAGDIASIAAFAVAATLSTATYIIAPVLALRAAVKWRRRKT